MKKLLSTMLMLLAITVSGFAQDSWTVAGSSAVFGTEWNQEDTSNDMVSEDGTIYTLTKSSVELTAGNYEYKVVKNHNWNESYPASNKSFTVHVSGTYNVTITFNADTKEVSEEVNMDGEAELPIITVSLLEPGSLGTEVLAAPGIDNLQDVTYLKVVGSMNDADWTTLSKMKNSLLYLDLQDASANNIPDNQFSEWPNLYYLTLPEGIVSIGASAFYKSNALGEIVFPETLKEIGSYAFYQSSIKKAYLPYGFTTLGEDCFMSCPKLVEVKLPDGLETIEYMSFAYCNALQKCNMPNNLKVVENMAFYKCPLLNFRLTNCTDLSYLGDYCFSETGVDSLFLPEHVNGNLLSGSHFVSCPNLVYAEFPVGFNSTNSYNIFWSCNNLNKIVLRSPTVLSCTDSGNHVVDTSLAPNVTVVVPSFAVSSYKLDDTWYQFTIEGFDPEEVKDWYIHAPLVLGNSRISGEPNIFVQWSSATLKINGDAPQAINNFYVENTSQLLSNCDQVTINGTYTHCHQVEGLKWYYISLPINFRVGDITTSNGASYAIRYYDGASRAANGSSGNWRNYTADDVVPAGTGFILQASKDCSVYFVAQDDASKQNALSNNEFVKSLTEHVSEQKADAGWNLVGNPWQSYYNIHKMNFTAPITVWDSQKNNYVAYSIIDDDYAIKPNEAFFVQCPNELYEITFPIDGRQFTTEIESQNGARSAQASERKLIDLQLNNGETSDKTRFVLNAQASMDYEVERDASKFFSMNATVPQIYTIENGTQLAINERPLGDGIVKIGMKIASDGNYTITAPRNQFLNIVLVDNETGIETALTSDSSYSFSADKGTNESRFVLRVGSAVITGVNAIGNSQSRDDNYYNLQGQRMTAPQKGLYIVNGKKVIK